MRLRVTFWLVHRLYGYVDFRLPAFTTRSGYGYAVHLRTVPVVTFTTRYPLDTYTPLRYTHTAFGYYTPPTRSCDLVTYHVSLPFVWFTVARLMPPVYRGSPYRSCGSALPVLLPYIYVYTGYVYVVGSLPFTFYAVYVRSVYLRAFAFGWLPRFCTAVHTFAVTLPRSQFTVVPVGSARLRSFVYATRLVRVCVVCRYARALRFAYVYFARLRVRSGSSS